MFSPKSCFLDEVFSKKPFLDDVFSIHGRDISTMDIHGKDIRRVLKIVMFKNRNRRFSTPVCPFEIIPRRFCGIFRGDSF